MTEPTTGPTAAGAAAKRSSFKAGRWMRLYVLPHRRRFLLISLLTLAASLLTVLQPWPMAVVADQVLGGHDLPAAARAVFASLGMEPGPMLLLGIAAGGGLFLFMLNSVVELILTSSWTLAGRRMVYDLSRDLFAALQRRSILFHGRQSVGDTMSRITGDSWAVYQAVDSVLFAPAHALLTLVLMVFLMVRLDAGLTLMAVAVAPFIVGASFLIGKPLHLAAKLRREIESKIQSHLQQTLTGIPVVQAFAQEDREQERLRRYTDDAVRAQQRSAVLGSLNSLGSGLVATLGAGAILWMGARHVLDGKLTIGHLLVFLVYLTTLQGQVKVLAAVQTTWRSVSASLERVSEMLEGSAEVKEAADAVSLPPVRGEIVFENVTFGYEPGRPVLRELSLRVSPGETVAIVGLSGCGKSTLVNLVPRLFDPSSGCVQVDGHDLRTVQLESLRRQVGVMLQEPFLFPLSVAENIAFGRPEAGREEIVAAARVASAHDFIERLPSGYDTVLGERGVTLSGGERQRLAIARALLKNAPILILDEPTSSLDAQTEMELLDALERLMVGRTTLLIAHRLLTVRRANRIVVLQDGVIREEGTHAELLEHEGLYAQWHDMQTKQPRTEPAST